MTSPKIVSGFQPPPQSPSSSSSSSKDEIDSMNDAKKEEAAKKTREEEEEEEGGGEKQEQSVVVEDASENAKKWQMAGLPPLPTTDAEVKRELNKLMRQESFTSFSGGSSNGSNNAEQQQQQQNTTTTTTKKQPSQGVGALFANNKQTSALTSNLRRVDSTLLANTVMCRPETDPEARLEETSTWTSTSAGGGRR